MPCVWENMCIWHLKEPVSIVSLFVNGVILMICEGVSLLFISFFDRWCVCSRNVGGWATFVALTHVQNIVSWNWSEQVYSQNAFHKASDWLMNHKQIIGGKKVVSNAVPNGNVFPLKGCNTDAEKPGRWANMSGIPWVCAEQLAKHFRKHKCTQCIHSPNRLSSVGSRNWQQLDKTQTSEHKG